LLFEHSSMFFLFLNPSPLPPSLPPLQAWDSTLGGFQFDLRIAEVLADRFNEKWRKGKGKGKGRCRGREGGREGGVG